MFVVMMYKCFSDVKKKSCFSLSLILLTTQSVLLPRDVSPDDVGLMANAFSERVRFVRSNRTVRVRVRFHPAGVDVFQKRRENRPRGDEFVSPDEMLLVAVDAV
jgi:hypothetical protein